MTVAERVVLLLEQPDGNTVGVVCNSREAADKIRSATPHEVVGLVPVISFVRAIRP